MSVLWVVPACRASLFFILVGMIRLAVLKVGGRASRYRKISELLLAFRVLFLEWGRTIHPLVGLCYVFRLCRYFGNRQYRLSTVVNEEPNWRLLFAQYLCRQIPIELTALEESVLDAFLVSPSSSILLEARRLSGFMMTQDGR